MAVKTTPSVKTLVNVRIDTDLLARFDAACRERGVSRSYRIRELMNADAEALAYTVGRTVGEKRLEPEAQARVDKAAEDWPENCPHPKAELVKRQYGTWCGLCQLRVR